jgi:hypothetical protein
VPCTNGLGHLRRSRKAKAAQCFERLGIVFGTGEDEAAALLTKRRCRLEEFGVVIADTLEPPRQGLGEFRTACKPHEAGDMVEIGVG